VAKRGKDSNPLPRLCLGSFKQAPFCSSPRWSLQIVWRTKNEVSLQGSLGKNTFQVNDEEGIGLASKPCYAKLTSSDRIRCKMIVWANNRCKCFRLVSKVKGLRTRVVLKYRTVGCRTTETHRSVLYSVPQKGMEQLVRRTSGVVE